MKTKLLFSGILVVIFSLKAQGQVADSVEAHGSSIDFRKLIDKEFTRLLTGDNSSFGSYAKVTTEDDIASIAGTIKLGKRCNLNVTAKGGVSEGLIPLVSGGTTSPKISLGTQLNIGLYKTKGFIYSDGTAGENLLYSIDSLGSSVDKKKREIDRLRQKLSLDTLETRLKIDQKKEHVQKLDKLKSKVIRENSSRKQLVLDSINYAKSKVNYELQDLVYLLDDQRAELESLDDDELSRRRQNINDKASATYRGFYTGEILEGYTMSWFSVKSNLTNRTFKHFTDSVAFDQQVVKRRFNHFELGVLWNYYLHRTNQAFKTLFLSAGISVVNTDNFGDLSSVSLTTKTPITSGSPERYTSETTTVYTGTYNTNLLTGRFLLDAYWFLDRKSLLALHVNPSYWVVNGAAPERFNLKLGLVVGLKDKDDSKNVVNLELFYNMLDMFKAVEAGDDETIEDRAILGVNLNFPITFK